MGRGLRRPRAQLSGAEPPGQGRGCVGAAEAAAAEGWRGYSAFQLGGGRGGEDAATQAAEPRRGASWPPPLRRGAERGAGRAELEAGVCTASRHPQFPASGRAREPVAADALTAGAAAGLARCRARGED